MWKRLLEGFWMCAANSFCKISFKWCALCWCQALDWEFSQVRFFSLGATALPGEIQSHSHGTGRKNTAPFPWHCQQEGYRPIPLALPGGIQPHSHIITRRDTAPFLTVLPETPTSSPLRETAAHFPTTDTTHSTGFLLPVAVLRVC